MVAMSARGSNVSPIPGAAAAGWHTELAVEGGVGNSWKRAYPVVTLLSAGGGAPGSRKPASRVHCAALWGSGSSGLRQAWLAVQPWVPSW